MSDRLVLKHVGGSLLICGADAETSELEALQSLCTQIPTVPSALTIVASKHVAVDALARLIRSETLAPYQSICWVTQLDADAAQKLAGILARPLFVSTGGLILPSSGTLFAASADGSPAHWVEYRPDGRSVVSGRRHPAPTWQRHLATLPEVQLDPEFELTEVPAGLWLRTKGEVAPDDLAYSMVPDRHRLTLLLSRPDQAIASPADVAAIVRVLGLPVADLILVPYGQRVVNGTHLARWVSEPINVQTGLMLNLDGDEAASAVAIGRDGTPTWLPLATELRYLPGNAEPAVVGVRQSAAFPPVFWPGWRTKIVPAGLWLYWRATHDDAVAAASIAPDPDTCLLIVGSRERRKVPKGLVGRAIAALPRDAQERVRVSELADLIRNRIVVQPMRLGD